MAQLVSPSRPQRRSQGVPNPKPECDEGGVDGPVVVVVVEPFASPRKRLLLKLVLTRRRIQSFQSPRLRSETVDSIVILGEAQSLYRDIL